MPEQEISAHSLSPDATAGLYDRIDELLSEIDQACDDFEDGGTPLPPMPVLKASPPATPPQPPVPALAKPEPQAKLQPEPNTEPEPEPDPEPKQGSEPTPATDTDALVEPESVQEDAIPGDEDGQAEIVDDALDSAGPDDEAADTNEGGTPEATQAAAPAAVDPNQSLLDSINAQLANLHAPSEPEVAKPPTPEPELAETELPKPELAEPELPAPPKAPEPKRTPEPAKKSSSAPVAAQQSAQAAVATASSPTDLDPLDASDLDDIIAELDAVDAGHGRKSSEPKLPTPIPSVTADETDLADEESFDDSFDHDALDEPAASSISTTPTKQVASTPAQSTDSNDPSEPKSAPAKQPAAKASKPPRSKPADLLKRLEPVFYRAGTAVLTPLAGVLKDQPRVVRDTLGWLAASTVFYGIILWSYVLIFRSASQPNEAPQGVSIVEQNKP